MTPMPFDDLSRDVAGRHQHKVDPRSGKPMVNGPFGFVESTHNSKGELQGVGGGFGLLSGNMGQGARGDVMQAQGHFGGWSDAEGKTQYGAELDAAVVRTGIERGGALGPMGFNVSAFDANANAKVSNETASLGAQANVIGGSISAGTDEHNLSLGASFGVGAGGRLHYGDADGDGVREYGLGADIGPVSFDVKSELLGHVANGATNAWNGASRMAGQAWNGATNMASNAWNGATNMAGSAWNKLASW